MQTFPDVDQRTGLKFAFEIENAYVNLRSLNEVLAQTPGVSDVQIRRLFARGWGENHMRFKYQGRDFVVWEPHGDSSRYWIGPPREVDRVDVTDLEEAFRSFEPPALGKALGDLLTMRVFRR